MWMSIEQAAEHLGCGKRTLWRRVGAGEYKSRKAGRRREVWVPSAPAELEAEAEEPAPLVSPFELETTGVVSRDELTSMGYVDAHEQAAAELSEMRQLIKQQAAELAELRARVSRLERSDKPRQEQAAPLGFPRPARASRVLPGRIDHGALLARFDACGMSQGELQRLGVVPHAFITKARRGSRRSVKARHTWLKLEAFLDGLDGELGSSEAPAELLA